MKLGAFSVSLNVKNLEDSKAFYEKLGFTTFAGEASQGWLIIKNGDTTIGLFQGMLKSNILTFNPGWDQDCNTLTDFDDVRSIQKTLKEKGVVLNTEADESTQEPANIMLEDPDGNQILIDQHV